MTEPGPSADLLIRGAADALMTGLAGAAARCAPAAATTSACRGGLISRHRPPWRPEPGERVIDARGCVIYPGWVNTHHHLFQSLLKGIPAGINLALVPWLAAVPVPYRRYFDGEELRCGWRRVSA